MQTILLVDDEPSLLRALTRSLKARGFIVIAALGVSDARVAMRRTRVDCCILDIYLNAEWGLDLVGDLHAVGARIVVLSGGLTISLTSYATLELGAHAVVPKPANEDELVAAILGRPVPPPDQRQQYKVVLASLERELITQRLIECGGNITHAARSLGIHRQSLQRKLRKLPPRDPDRTW